MTCTAVTSRASEGPCAVEGCGRSAPPLPMTHVRWGEGVPHAYLGPVVERCGHPESEHMLLMCIECEWPSDHSLDGPYDIEWEHAYTEEPVAQSQERRG